MNKNQDRDLVNYSKPTWMPRRHWKPFKAKWQNPEDGYFYCQLSQKRIEPDRLEVTDKFSVDHIEAKSLFERGFRFGDPNAFSNLWPVDFVENSRKGTKPAAQWNRALFFDREVNIENLRVSQREFVYKQILRHARWFGLPYSQINGKMFLFPQVVGAGKTIGKAMVPFALNHASMLEYGGNRPRVNSCLILTKEGTLRDQIAHELAEELTEFRIITGAKPAVLNLDNPTIQIENGDYHGYDFAVGCPNKLVWSEKGEFQPWLEKLLRHFQVIIFDETHYAHNQIKRLLSMQLGHNIVFGFTATPIDAAAMPLDAVAKFPPYGYREATINDNSMKAITPRFELIDDPAYDFEEVITEIATSRVRDLDGTWHELRGDQRQRGHAGGGLHADQSIIVQVLQTMHELDYVDDSAISDHRTAYNGHAQEVGDRFFGHAIIRVDRIADAKSFCDSINRHLKRYRDKYPAEHGWRAVYSAGSELLDKDSPFFYAVKNDGRVSKGAARILVVAQRAQEGMNHKYLSVIAFTRHVNSVRSAIQSIGRLIRSPHGEQKNANGETTHLVPPAKSDLIRIITHKSCENRSVLVSALKFIANMDAGTADIETIEEHFSDWSGFLINNRQQAGSLSRHEKRLVAAQIERYLGHGRPVDDQAISRLVGGANSGKQAIALRFVQECRAARNDAVNGGDVRVFVNRELGLNVSLTEIAPIDAEQRDVTESDDILVSRYRLTIGDDILEQLAPATQAILCRRFQTKVLRHYESYDLLSSDQQLEAFFDEIELEIREQIKLYGCRVGKCELRQLIASSILEKVPHQDGEVRQMDCSNSGPYNRPAIVSQLASRRHRDELVGHVLNVLVKNGKLPFGVYMTGE